MAGTPAAILGHRANLERKPLIRRVEQRDGGVLSPQHRGATAALCGPPHPGRLLREREPNTHQASLSAYVCHTWQNLIPIETYLFFFRIFLAVFVGFVFYRSLRISLFRLKIRLVSF